ncbi:MAG: hypothetical protein JWQ89_1366 [Devosia sp.]|uniref:hypothetical protein n=1 Tax=Devosia sp. TaxID=1871048 RepID=UPI00262AABFD|nr:hypothetical protein [Devosia sp.]MDB5539639.1 hypothetical protein [Devosia sp.]
MRSAYLLGAFFIGVLSVAPVAAAEAGMTADGKMQNSMAMAMMPDGQMGWTNVSDDAAGKKISGLAKPIANCSMIITDKSGKMHIVDTATPEAKAECEKLAMTPPAAAGASEAAPGKRMEGDTAMAMMPDGHMGRMKVSDAATATKMMGMAKPASGCLLVTSDKDGKISMVETRDAEAKAECDRISKMSPAQ